MTAGDVVERIRKNVGVPWRDATYRDTFKAGGTDIHYLERRLGLK